MKNQNKKLMDEAIEQKFKIAVDPNEEESVRQSAFRQATDAMKIQSDIRKDFWESILKALGVVVPLTVVGVNWIARFAFGKAACNFEKENSFTTMAGRSLSSIFRFD